MRAKTLLVTVWALLETRYCCGATSEAPYNTAVAQRWTSLEIPTVQAGYLIPIMGGRKVTLEARG